MKGFNIARNGILAQERFLTVAVIALGIVSLGACSKAPAADAANQGATSTASAQPATSFLDTQSGRYQVDLDPSIDPKLMPTNADLKMVDGDLGQYALKLCGLDFSNKQRPDRCEVFVQPDKSGFLVGYAVLLQGQDVRIDTAVETDTHRSGLGCFLNGELENTDYEHSDSKIDISKNFSARMGYSAWEKSPGNWMVSTGEDNGDSQGANGMWYIKREGNKLRISQERWNYCYSNSKIYLDEVFRRAVTLTLQGATATAPTPLTTAKADMSTVRNWKCDGASGPFRMTFSNVENIKWGKYGDVTYSPSSPFGFESDNQFSYDRKSSDITIGQEAESNDPVLHFKINNQRGEMVFVSGETGDSIVCKPA